MKLNPILRLAALLSATSIFMLTSCEPRQENREWAEYLGGPDRNHYSDLDQINLSNVSTLEKAWIYHTRDSGQMQCSPIVVNGILYGVTASVEPFALDAATGKEIWRVRDTLKGTWYGALRGVTYWQNGNDKRILYTRDSALLALNAETGDPILTFGDHGRVSLKTGLGETARSKFVVSVHRGLCSKI
jgi:quinoprotein glucose dehydrogenase